MTMTQEDSSSCGSGICQLPADEMRARRELMQHDLLPRARRRVRLPDGRAWEFTAEPGLRGRLEELVAFERECCPGLRWELKSVGDSGGLDVLRLEIGGLPPDHAFWDDGASLEASAGRSSVWPRVAKAVGLGGGVSFLLCCVLPVGAAALFGAAVAAPFARLDDPLVIGVGSLAASVPAWLWLRRRETQRLAVAARSGDGACGC
jgi:hypothetical protein